MRRYRSGRIGTLKRRRPAGRHSHAMTLRPHLAAGPATEPDLAPGQHLVTELPAEGSEPVPVVPTRDWTFTLTTENGEQRQWDWAAITAMPVENCCVDL